MSLGDHRLDLGIGAVLFAVGLGILYAFEARFGTSGLALGSDPVLWGLSAKNLSVGAESAVPPLYPAVMALLDPISGVSVIDAGLLLSRLSFAALLPAIFGVAMYLGAARWAAALAPLMVIAVPGLVQFGIQVQPDASTSLVLLLAVPLVGRFLDQPSWGRFGVLMVYGSFAAVLREHGVVLAILFAGVGAIGGGALKTRGARTAAMLVAICLAPMLTAHAPSLPWQAPWTSRIAMAVGGAEKEPLSRDVDVQVLQRAHEQAHKDGDVVGIMEYHVYHSIKVARTEWSWMVVGILGILIGVPRRRWIPVLLPMVPSMPALIVYSQDRHITVAIPVTVAVLAKVLSGRVWMKVLAVVGAILLVMRGVNSWQASPRVIDNKVRTALDAKEAGERLCQLARPGELASGRFFDARVYCPMPHTGRVDDALAWNTWVMSENWPGNGWKVYSRPYSYYSDTFYIWRFRPDLEGAERPCGSSNAAPDTPYFDVSVAHSATVEPPCTW